MRLRSSTVLLGVGMFAACAGSGDDGYPTRGGTGGGGGGGGGSGARDAGVDAADAGPAIGRVCLTSDLRTPEKCAATGAAGITVTRGTASATTRADGTFTLPPATAVGNWQASRTDLVTTVVPYVAGAGVLIPIIATTDWNTLRAANPTMIVVDGQGSLLVASYRPSGLPKPQVVVSTDPAGVPGVFYDTSVAQTWGTAATGPLGMSLAPGLPAGTINVAGIGPDASRSSPLVPIVAGAITFVRLDFVK